MFVQIIAVPVEDRNKKLQEYEVMERTGCHISVVSSDQAFHARHVLAASAIHEPYVEHITKVILTAIICVVVIVRKLSCVGLCTMHSKQ